MNKKEGYEAGPGPNSDLAAGLQFFSKREMEDLPVEFHRERVKILKAYEDATDSGESRDAINRLIFLNNLYFSQQQQG